MMNMFDVGSPYHMYMMEKEGMLNTHASKVNKLIKTFNRLAAHGHDINDEEVQEHAFQECDISYEDLTDRDIRRIKSAIENSY